MRKTGSDLVLGTYSLFNSVKSTKLNFTVVLAVLFFTVFSFGQEARLVAKVSKKTLGENQRLRISYEINNQEADDFQLPNFKNFKVVQGPSQSVSNSYSFVNGKAQSNFSKTYTYILKPIKRGVFTLPPATIIFEGEKIESNKITINVVQHFI